MFLAAAPDKASCRLWLQNGKVLWGYGVRKVAEYVFMYTAFMI